MLYISSLKKSSYQIDVEHHQSFRMIRCSHTLYGNVCVLRLDPNDKEALKQLECPGIYILLGETKTYIGQTQQLRQRLVNHKRQKEWLRAVYLCTDLSQSNRVMPYLECLESEFIRRAKDAGIKLDNKAKTAGNPSVYDSLNNKEVQNFIDDATEMLTIMGCTIFEKREAQEFFVFKNAKAYRSDNGEFVVCKGSRCEKTTEDFNKVKINDCYKRLLAELYNNGTIDKNKRFTHDYNFSSPSQAAKIISGGSINGLDAWKDSNGKSLNDLYK